MRKQLLTLFAFAFASFANAQTPDWSVPVDGKAESIFFNSFTQTPILETNNKFVGFDAEKKSQIWTIDKSKFNTALKLSNKINNFAGESKNLEEEIDYEEIDYTQFARINNFIIDVATGQVVLGDDNTAFKKMEAWDVIPSLNLALIKVTTEDAIRVYAVDIATDAVLWNVKVADSGKGKDALKFLARQAGLQGLRKLVAPSVNPDGNIIYGHAKNLYLINAKSGEVIWTNECNPAMAEFSPDSKYVVVAEAAGGLATGSFDFSRKVNCIDTKTGKSTWGEPIKLGGIFTTLYFEGNDQVILGSSGDVCSYSLSSNTQLWKKAYSATDVYNFERTDEGIIVYYSNKAMCLDPATGTKVWKSAETLKDVDEDAGKAFHKMYGNAKLVYTPKKLIIYPKDKFWAKAKFNFSIDETDRVGFDDKNNKVIVLNGKKIFIIDPQNDSKRSDATAAKVSSPKDIIAFNIVDDGYFIYGMKEYVKLNGDKSVAGQADYPQLKTNMFAKTFLALSRIQNEVMSTTITYGDQTIGLFCSAEEANQQAKSAQIRASMLKDMKANDKLKKAVRANNNIGVFMTSAKENGEEVVALAVVDKNSGKEIKRVTFSHNRAVVYEVDLNTNTVYYFEDGKFNAMKL